ncbi:MAG: hypothetical protein Q9168_005805 [Polycauliona sp. 1 TL-2023]
MKTIISIAAMSLITFASASDQCAVSAAAIPSCAAQCIVDAGRAAANCAPNDYTCPCAAANQAPIRSAALPCLLSACGSNAIASVNAAATAVCDCVATATGETIPEAPTTTAEAGGAPTATVMSTATEETVVATTSVPYPTGGAATATRGSMVSGNGTGPVAPFVPGGASFVEVSLGGVIGALVLAMFVL